MTETLISVVIPVYNYARTLPRAVESVLAQLDETTADLLVIDDGSTDDTPEVVERLLLKHGGVFVRCVKATADCHRCAIGGWKRQPGDIWCFSTLTMKWLPVHWLRLRSTLPVIRRLLW